MKLCAYTYNEQLVGIDILQWDSADISVPFIILNDNDEIPENYADISSIKNWYNFSPDVNLAHMIIIDISNEIGYDNLTNEEKTIVDNIGFYYKIYKYIINYQKYTLQNVPHDIQYSINDAPYNLDYDVLGLHKKQIFVKGELLKVEYYGEFNPLTNTYSNLCLQEERIYNRAFGYLSNREMIISWYKSDGTVGDTKNTIKFYNTFDAITAGNKRRENIIDEIKIVTVGLIALTENIDLLSAEEIGKTFLFAISNNVALYVKGNENELIQQISVIDTFTFLDNVIPNTIGMNGTNGGITIRMYLIDALTIDYNKVYTLADKSPFSFFN